MSFALNYQKKIKEKEQKEKAYNQIAAAELLPVVKKPLKVNQETNQYKTLIGSIALDNKKLSGLTIAEKKAIKKEYLIPRYRPYCESYRDQEKKYTNHVLTHLIIWLFDIDEIDEALKWSYLAIAQNQPLPPQFNRKNIATFAADALLQWVNIQHHNASIEPYFFEVFQKIEDDKWAIPVQLIAKYHVKAGDLAFEQKQYKVAHDYYHLAQKINHHSIKRKTNIRKCLHFIEQEEKATKNKKIKKSETNK